MSYSSEIISPQKCFLKVSCFHCVLNPHGIIFSFTKSWALKKILIKTGASQWDSPTFVWLLLKERYNTPGVFGQSGEMPVFAGSRVSPGTREAGEGKNVDSQDAHQTLLFHTLSTLAKVFPCLCPILFVFWLLSLRRCCLTTSAPVPRTRGSSPSSAPTQGVPQQTTSRASVSPTVMNADRKQGHRNDAAVPKSF